MCFRIISEKLSRSKKNTAKEDDDKAQNPADNKPNHRLDFYRSNHSLNLSAFSGGIKLDDIKEAADYVNEHKITLVDFASNQFRSELAILFVQLNQSASEINFSYNKIDATCLKTMVEINKKNNGVIKQLDLSGCAIRTEGILALMEDPHLISVTIREPNLHCISDKAMDQLNRHLARNKERIYLQEVALHLQEVALFPAVLIGEVQKYLHSEFSQPEPSESLRLSP